MACRVGVHGRVAVPAGQRPGSQPQHPRCGGLDVIDHDVEMHLLGPVRVRPPRRLVAGHQLEADPEVVSSAETTAKSSSCQVMGSPSSSE